MSSSLHELDSAFGGSPNVLVSHSASFLHMDQRGQALVARRVLAVPEQTRVATTASAHV